MKPKESSRVPSGIKDHTLNWAAFEFFFLRRRHITCSGQSCLNVKQWNVVQFLLGKDSGGLE